MKKCICLLLAVLLAVSFASCTKQPDPYEVAGEEMSNQIAALGEITLQSRVAIEKAERAYNALDPEIKEYVTNWYDIILAKEAYKQCRIRRIEEKVQAAQAEFDETWSTWNLFYTLRDILKDCHPDEEYIVNEAIAKNEEMCFDGTHFIHFDKILEADERFTTDDPNVIHFTLNDRWYHPAWNKIYEPYTVREDGQSYYRLYFVSEWAAPVWGTVQQILDNHLELYQKEEIVIEGWGPASKQGVKTMVAVDDMGNMLCSNDWRSGSEFFFEIYIKPANPAKPAEPDQPAEPAAN